ncbi:hypothetical protein KVR01_002341 [Diaporthe batatas]|uniref:uncharacterized protein n=1 Tax=Diaporthe batatas TaxID=748121 RepID=UPI001D05181D|nr:uncharacterized protein KVR01_002341 [Diaporthe batatas]KAG8166652.1 hypothetical protein KVR01_002341 [Diaporthe batatas]
MEGSSNPRPSSEDAVPMSHRIDNWDTVNQQEPSPLFSVLPAELRSLIFEFALAEFTAPALDRPIQHEFSARDDHEKLDDEPNLENGPASEASDPHGQESSAQPPDPDDGPAPAVQPPLASFLLSARELKNSWDWFRPGYTGHRKMKTALLGTCRRVYLEACGLRSEGSKIFYNTRGPCWCPQSPAKYVSGLPRGAAQHIRNLQMFSQVRYLEWDLMDLVTGVFTAGPHLQRHMPQARLHPAHFVTSHSYMAFPRVSRAASYQGRLPASLPQHGYRPGSAGPAIWESLGQSSPTRLSEAGLISPWRLTEHLTSLRIYLRRTDWWNWEGNAPLLINPFSPQTSRASPPVANMLSSMRTSAEADKRIEPSLLCVTPSSIPRWDCWALLFLRMPNLKQLTIDFETSEDKKSEMEAIVEWARLRWRFPVLRRLSGTERDPYTFRHMQRSRNATPVDLSPWSDDLDVLSAADQPVQKTSWRGLPQHFSAACHACTAGWGEEEGAPDCEECTKRGKLLKLNKGPQLLVWTVHWERKVPPGHAQPEGSAGGEGSQERGGQPQPGSASAERQDGPGPRSAEYRARRRRELDELMEMQVMF